MSHDVPESGLVSKAISTRQVNARLRVLGLRLTADNLLNLLKYLAVPHYILRPHLYRCSEWSYYQQFDAAREAALGYLGYFESSMRRQPKESQIDLACKLAKFYHKPMLNNLLTAVERSAQTGEDPTNGMVQIVENFLRQLKTFHSQAAEQTQRVKKIGLGYVVEYPWLGSKVVVTDEVWGNLKTLIAEADAYFHCGRFVISALLYQALLHDFVRPMGLYSPRPGYLEVRDLISEVIAKYCRSVYHFIAPDYKVKALLKALCPVNYSSITNHLNHLFYTSMTDVLAVSEEPIADWGEFLPAWREALAGSDLRMHTHTAMLYLETTKWMEGLDAMLSYYLKVLPRTYFCFSYVLKQLALAQDWSTIAQLEPMAKTMNPQPYRQDDHPLLIRLFMMAARAQGRVEKLVHYRETLSLYLQNEYSFCAAIAEAALQGKRQEYIESMLKKRYPDAWDYGRYFEPPKIKLLLMAGKFTQALDLIEREDLVSRDGCSLSFLTLATSLYALTEQSPEATTCRQLLQQYAPQPGQPRNYYPKELPTDPWLEAFEAKAAYFDQICEGVQAFELSPAAHVQFLDRVFTHCDLFISAIVGLELRKEYKPAAQLLAAQCETLILLDQAQRAHRLVRSYLFEKYPKLKTFPSLIRNSFDSSPLLRRVIKIGLSS